MEENPELRTGTISANCPTSHYTIEASISSPANVELASVIAGFFIVEQPSEDSVDFVSEDQRVLGAAVHLMFARQIKIIVE